MKMSKEASNAMGLGLGIGILVGMFIMAMWAICVAKMEKVADPIGNMNPNEIINNPDYRIDTLVTVKNSTDTTTMYRFVPNK